MANTAARSMHREELKRLRQAVDEREPWLDGDDAGVRYLLEEIRNCIYLINENVV